MRNLVYIKLLHSERDYEDPDYMDALKREWDKYGISWVEYEKRIDEISDMISRDLLGVHPNKIFWDSYTGGDIAPWMKLAQNGSRGFQTLRWLLKRKAELMITESDTALADCSPDRIKVRDSGIAQVVDTTLLDGETGVLGMGVRHDVLTPMSQYKDILVRQIDYTQPTIDWLKSQLPDEEIPVADHKFLEFMQNNFSL